MSEARRSPGGPGSPAPESRPESWKDDLDLVARARRGEVDAFETLYRRHSPALFGLALRMFQNRTDAEDLVQEIFLAAYRKLERFEGRSAFGTWLYRLGMNRCLDQLRSRSAKEQTKNEPLDTSLSGHRFAGGSRTLELERAVGTLSPSARAAFLLHDVEGYGHREVGELLGIAVGTSKSLVHRARMQLRDHLQPPTSRNSP